MSNEPFLRDAEKANMAEAAQLVMDAGRDIVRFIVRLIPALFRLACVSVCAMGVVYGTVDAWQAFGGDGIAAIPAFALGLIPLLFAFISGVKWGGIVAAGAFTYGVAQVLLTLPFPLNQLSIVIVLAALTFSDMARRQMDPKQNE